MPVSTAKQLSIFLENRPGVLAKLCRAMSAAGISLKAISVSDSVDHAVVRVVVDKPAKARALFEEHHLLVIENDVLAVSMPDRPGELGKVAARLSKAKLNINYLYGSSANGEKHSTVYLRVSGPASSIRAALKGL